MGAQGIAIGISALQNATEGKAGNVSTLTKLADFFKITPEQLLQPDLGAGAMGISEEVMHLARQMDTLVGRRRELVLSACRDAVELAVNGSTAPPPAPASEQAHREKRHGR